jgi:hypothetical protein
LNFTLGRFCFFFFCLLPVAGIAAASAHAKALALRERDPIEAEALLARFVKETGSDKLRRAARYDLFYLRLSNNRLVEAFGQGLSDSFRRKYREAVSMRFNLTPKQASRLIGRLEKACGEKEISDSLGAFLSSGQYGAAVYEFAIRTMQNCQIESAAEILSPEIWAAKAASERRLALKLLKIRYSLDDAALATEQLANIATVDAELLAATPVLSAQHILLQARVALAQGDLSLADSHCKALVGRHAKSQREACRFLTAFHLAENEQFTEAYKLLQAVEIAPSQIDYRLMRLTLAVAVKRVGVSKLQKFTRRASYRYSAASVRALAEKVIAGENKTQN